MRLIVPLQAVVQGRGGLFFGSLIPCGLFFCLQLYLKRKRTSPSPSSANLPGIVRSSSRTNLTGQVSVGPVPIASRALSIGKPSDSPYYMGWARASEDPYDRVRNPDGVIQLGLSENRLCFDLIEKWMDENLKESILGGEGSELVINGILTYQPHDGVLELKVALAAFMSRIMGGGVSFDPSQIAITGGATPAIDILSFCLADHGDALLVPTPYYPGFDLDVKWRTGVDLIPVNCRSTDNFVPSITALEQAYNQARKRGVKVRGVLFSNPVNPVGYILPREVLYELLDFARDKNIHIICDEIFAGSVYGTDKFVSMAEILETEELDKNRVHLIYALTKDLSLAGFRVGAIYSYNEMVLAAVKKLTRFSSVPGLSQRLLIAMLSDTRFIDEYMSTHKSRLLKMHDLFVEGLKQVGIPCTESHAGFFCWADMSGLIPSFSEKGELELWEKLLNIAKVNVTPGSACHCIEPGWFRCCFTTLAQEDIPVVIERISKVLDTSKSNN